MKCYNCGCNLSEKNFCTGCGVDVTLYKKIIYMSNRYYNDGLEKANVRDLSGAIISLKQSLKLNKNNMNARNLLGLVYYETGEAVAALGEWVISKNLKNNKNIADDYIRMVQSNPTKLDAMNQTIKKYNQALAYCYQDSLDLAVIQLKKVLSINPNLVKGYQLLALLYIQAEEWGRAERTLNRALKIDSSNTLTLKYLKETEKMLNKQEDSSNSSKKKKAAKEEVITYQSGNETIIQPINTKKTGGLSTVANIMIGLIVGALMGVFLIVPAMNKADNSDVNKNFTELSDQLAAKNAAVSELEQRVQALEDEKTALQEEMEAVTGSEGVLKTSDYLLQAGNAYIEDKSKVIEIMDYLGNIDKAYLESGASEPFKSLYETIYNDISKKAAKEYYNAGMTASKEDDYATAITELTKAWELDETNVDALYNLAHAYRNSNNTTKADELYKQVIELFPNTRNARNAQGYLSDSNNEAQAEAANEENGDEEEGEDIPNNSNPVVPQAPVIPDPTPAVPEITIPTPGIDPITGLPLPAVDPNAPLGP